MSTLPSSQCHVKVVALLTRQRERVLVDEPLTIDTLALLQPRSPLSNAFRDGAGMQYRPLGIAVYVDGKLVWERLCSRHGRTDASPTTVNGKQIEIVPFADAFPEDWEWDDERIAANRASWELLHNGHDDWAEDFAADLMEAAGSARPVLRPAPLEPEYEPPVDRQYAPDPCERFGDTDGEGLGLPYRPSGSWRHVGAQSLGEWKPSNGIEFLPAGYPYIQPATGRSNRRIVIRWRIRPLRQWRADRL